MVSILPGNTRTPWDIIGAQIGQNLHQTLPGAVEKGYERGQIQQGLDKVAEQHPQLKVLLDAMAPFAGTRQGSQYTETLIPEILKLVQSGQQTNPQTAKSLSDIDQMIRGRNEEQFKLPSFGEKQGQTPQVQRPIAQESVEPNFNKISQELKNKLGEQYFPFPKKAENAAPGESRRPAKPPKVPKPIGPVEEQKIRSELVNNGVTRREVQDDYINKFKQQQSDEYKAASEGYANAEEYRKAKDLEDERFYNSVKPQLEATYGEMGPDEINIWRGIARTNEDIGGDEARYRDTTQRYNQLVEQPIAAFVDTGPELPYFSAARPEAVKDAVEDSRSIIQNHLDTIKSMETNDSFPPELKSEISNFLRKKYRTAMVEKDFGVAQSAYAVSNLSPKTERTFNSMPKYPSEENLGKREQYRGIQPFVSNEEKAKYTERLASVLSKLDPEDSLILARDMAIQNHYPEDVFNRALNMAQRDGLKLSPFQMQERPELSIPQRMDLNSVLRGKRSVYDLFKGKK